MHSTLWPLFVVITDNKPFQLLYNTCCGIFRIVFVSISGQLDHLDSEHNADILFLFTIMIIGQQVNGVNQADKGMMFCAMSFNRG